MKKVEQLLLENPIVFENKVCFGYEYAFESKEKEFCEICNDYNGTVKVEKINYFFEEELKRKINIALDLLLEEETEEIHIEDVDKNLIKQIIKEKVELKKAVILT